MFNIIKKFKQYGIVTIDYPRNPLNNNSLIGKPVVDENICNQCGICVLECPTKAILMSVDQKQPIKFSLDKCIFCRICEDVCPQNAICMTHQFEMAVTDKKEIAFSSEECVGGYSGEDYEIIGQRLKKGIGKKFGRSLNIREVDAGSCNGCDNEANALNGPYNDLERLGINFVASPRHADMLLVTGPVTKNMELALVKTYNAIPDPKLVVAVGTCAISGGIFAGSYATRKGVDTVIPVDAYVPGCPPRPQAIIYGILKAIERI